jgi:hypothetical protein
MGYMRHHVIVVTSFSSEKLLEARQHAVGFCGPLVSPVVRSDTNGYVSFFVAPDGSKEGWEASDKGDNDRKNFILWLNSKRSEDGCSYLDWVEVQYGDDEGYTKIIDDSDAWYRDR